MNLLTANGTLTPRNILWEGS